MTPRQIFRKDGINNQSQQRYKAPSLNDDSTLPVSSSLGKADNPPPSPDEEHVYNRSSLSANKDIVATSGIAMDSNSNDTVTTIATGCEDEDQTNDHKGSKSDLLAHALLSLSKKRRKTTPNQSRSHQRQQ